MERLRWATAAVVLAVCAVSPARAATDDELRQQIVGRWGLATLGGTPRDPLCREMSIDYRADGTFTLGGPSRPAIEGTYVVEDGTVRHVVPGERPERLPLSFEGPEMRQMGEDGRSPAVLVRCPAG